MQTFLFGKFFGKALLLDQVKLTLTDLWKNYGAFSVADMLNGFYFIRCQASKMLCKLFWERPWTVREMVLQLAQISNQLLKI